MDNEQEVPGAAAGGGRVHVLVCVCVCVGKVCVPVDGKLEPRFLVSQCCAFTFRGYLPLFF